MSVKQNCCSFLRCAEGFCAAQVQPEPYNDAQDDDYSLEGWGFDSSPSDQSDQPIVDRPLSIADAGSVAVQPVVTVPRVLPAAVSADTVVASAVKPRSDSIVTYKDTPNFRQVRTPRPLLSLGTVSLVTLYCS